MRKTALGAACVAVAGLVALGAGVADAAGPVHVNAYQQLRLDQGTTCAGAADASTIGWQSGTDSPLDANTRALVGVVDSGGCVDAFTRSSLNINKSAGAIKNLSFDFKSDEFAGGDPRISVIFGNGDVAYLSGDHCSQPIAVSGGAWSRADFTGSTTSNSAACQMYVTGVTGNGGLPYESTSTQSVWAVYVAANPTQTVAYDFFVLDFPDTAGAYHVDRLSLGTGFMFTYDSTHAVKCVSESTC
jgi:hypothetical protein